MTYFELSLHDVTPHWEDDHNFLGVVAAACFVVA
jgi:hypothetical protein